MSETQKLTFKDLICSKLEGSCIQAVSSGNYIVIRVPRNWYNLFKD